MNAHEDLGPDRRIGFETDDEENQAERICFDDNEYDTESDGTNPSPCASNVCIDKTSWPQSYRQSMDVYSRSMTPPSFSFLTRTGSTTTSSSFTRVPDQPSTLPNSSLNKPLISASSLEEVPTSFNPVKFSSTSQLSASLVHELYPPTQQCSFVQSVFNAINVLCGIGILSTPYALKEGGWWSLLILFSLGIIACYTGILLKRCLESSPGLQTYPDIGQAAFGVPGRVCLAIILYIELYSSCVEHLIMMSDNLSLLFPNAYTNFAGLHLDPYQICMIVSTLSILPTVWLRDLSLLSYISVGGVLTALLVSLCLLWVGVVDQVGFHSSGNALDLGKLPVTIGIFGFCYGSHSVFPNIYSSMKEPSQFPSVLLISFVASCFLYAGVGICGFLMFGDSTKSQITLNIPTKFVASKVAAWTTVISPVTKYALTITPVAFSLEELLPSARFKSHGVSLLIRTVLVLSTAVVALTVPYFGSVMAFIGSFLVMLVSLIFPSACYLSICRNKLNKSQISACIAIINVGLVCAIIGTYSSITSMINQRG